MKKRIISIFLAGMLLAASLAGCSNTQNNSESGTQAVEQVTGEQSGEEAEQQSAGAEGTQVSDGQIVVPESIDWHSRPLNVIDDKYRTFYEIFVYSFYDSDGDGIGDLQGVIEKLDYLNDGDDTTDTDLGINGIWLMPIMQSTTYHKYDVVDYMSIDSEYGDMGDFDQLIEECHKRGINVIIDLAINHSSSQHQWFQEAVQYIKGLPDGAELDPAECPYVEYYNFTKEMKSGYTQIAGTEWYYESQFWSEMPDLNLYNEAVRSEFEAIADFWLEKGVDGFRMDAVKEFVSGDVNANTEILAWFNDYVKSVDPDTYIVCECWTDSNTYSQYYASGVDSMFDFEFGDKDGIISNVLNGKSSPSAYAKEIIRDQELFAQYNAEYIPAPFYTNHDLNRSASYYAGEYSMAQTKMAQAMNLLMSGNAFIYYGEELGMKGSTIDENKRAPMYWSKDENATGMCDGPAAMEDFEMKYDSLEEQSADPDSIYNFVKEVIRLRNQNPEIARGIVTYYEDASSLRTCVLSKEYEGKQIVLVFNTSKLSQEVALDQVVVGDKTAAELVTLGELLTGEEEIERTETGVVMPAYSVLLLGEE